MADLRDILSTGRAVRSIEIWPARNAKQAEHLGELLSYLPEVKPDFISVTYGALGSTRERSIEMVKDLILAGFNVVAHLACLGHTRDELVALIRYLEGLGVSGILALRGDSPIDAPELANAPELCHAIDLVELVRLESDLAVAVALHPDGHPESPDPKFDLERALEKLSLADLGVTQFFFEFPRFDFLLKYFGSLGIEVPILPGFMIPGSPRQLERMSQMAALDLPESLVEAAGPDGPATFERVATSLTLGLAEQSLAAGARGLHLFSMNSKEAVRLFMSNFPPAPVGDPRSL